MARSRRGAGTERKRPNGLWEIRVVVDGQRLSFYGPTLTAARAKAAAARRPQPRPGAGSLGAWAAEWLEGRRGAVRAQTWGAYESKLRLYVVPRIGHLRLSDVDERTLEALYADLRADGVGPTTIAHTHTTLVTLLGDAVRRGLLLRSPTATVPAPKRRERPKVILSRADAGLLVAAAREAPLGAAFVLAVTVGMRSGELRALRWRDVDLAAGRLTVTGSMARGYSGELEPGEPKTATSRRTIRLPRVAVEALRRTPRRSELVFAGEDGKAIHPRALLRDHLGPVLRAAGLPPMPIHDLRHTAATHALEDGTPAHAVAAMLGHASVATTLRLYGHVTGQMTEAAVEAMDRRYSQPVEASGGI